MEGDDFQCGNDLRYLLGLVNGGGHGPGPDPKFGQLVHQLASLTQALVGVVVSTQLANQGLAREFHAESGKALVAAANKMASAAV